MGDKDDVVVDSISDPTRVVGIADGKGSVLYSYSPQQSNRVRAVVEEITSRIVGPALNRPGE